MECGLPVPGLSPLPAPLRRESEKSGGPVVRQLFGQGSNPAMLTLSPGSTCTLWVTAAVQPGASWLLEKRQKYFERTK